MLTYFSSPGKETLDVKFIPTRRDGSLLKFYTQGILDELNNDHEQINFLNNLNYGSKLLVTNV